MRQCEDFIGTFLEYSQPVETSPLFLKWTAISIIAATLERKTWINFNNMFLVHPNQYIFIIAPSGLVRKSTSTAVGIKLLREAATTQLMSTQATVEATITELSDIANSHKVMINGEEFNSGAAFLYASEAYNSFGDSRGASSTLQFLTDIYDCGPDGWHRKHAWTKRTQKSGKVSIFNPCINILACTTPEWLEKFMPMDDLKGGFGGRIIYVVEMQKSERSIGIDEDAKLDEGLKAALINDLKIMSRFNGEFKLTPDFSSLFNQFKKQNMQKIEASQGSMLIGYYSRKEMHLLKLSQILSASSYNHMTLTKEVFYRALNYLDEVEVKMHEAFSSNNPISIVWRSIRHEKGKFPKSLITERVWRELNESEVASAIRQLRELGRLDVHFNGTFIECWVKDNSPLN